RLNTHPSACNSLLSPHATPPPPTHTLSLHDALPISQPSEVEVERIEQARGSRPRQPVRLDPKPTPLQLPDERQQELVPAAVGRPDRKSTRLNSSHSQISYAVFCLKKKNKTIT